MAVPAVKVREWLTLNETMEALEKSSSTIERLVGSDRLRSKLEPRPGRKAERMYHAGDVERLKRAEEEGHRKPALMLPKPTASQQPAAFALTAETRDFAREIITSFTAPRGLPLREKLWLSLDEAAAYSGLSRSYLRDSCVPPEAYSEGQNLIGVRGGPHNSFRIQRASLEAFAG